MGRRVGLGIMGASLIAAGAARAMTNIAVAEEEARRDRAKALGWDECAATGAGHSYGPHGPDGEQQCAYCGIEPMLEIEPYMFDSIKVFDESPAPVLTLGYGVEPKAPAVFDPDAPLPDRLSVNPESPFYDKDLLARVRLGVRFDGKDRPGDVEEYCISEGWIRVQTYLANGKVRRERGKIICLKKWGKVEPYRK